MIPKAVTEKHREQVFEFLRSQPLMVLASCSEEGADAVTLFYFMDDDNAIYFATRKKTKKVENLAAHPNVGILVSDGKTFDVQVKGKAELLESSKDRADLSKKILGKVSEDLTFWPPILKMKGRGDVIICKFTPKFVRAFDLTGTKFQENGVPVEFEI